MQIRSFPVEKILGPLAAPRERLRWVRKWGTIAALAIYLVAMFTLFPKETWIDMDAYDRRLTLTGVLFLIGPACVVLALLALWGMRDTEGWKGNAAIALVGGELTLEMNGRVLRRVPVSAARTHLASWPLHHGHLGTLLRIDADGEHVTLGTYMPPPSNAGPPGVPDASMEEREFRELAAALGVDVG